METTYRIVTWHGESNTLWCLVKEDPLDPNNWEVVSTYNSREEAETALQALKPYIEQDCTFEHEGKLYTSGGAFVSPTHIIAYPKGKDPIFERINGHTPGRILNDPWKPLCNWHGREIGTWRAVAWWRTPHSYLSSRLFQIEAKVNNVLYTGRGAGSGCIFRGKAKRIKA